MRNRAVRAFDVVQLEIARLRESGLTWRALARRYPEIPEARMAACLCAVYKHGREPHATEIRAVLGLPLTVAVAVCPHCGKPPLARHHHCIHAIPVWVSAAADWLAERERK